MSVRIFRPLAMAAFVALPAYALAQQAAPAPAMPAPAMPAPATTAPATPAPAASTAPLATVNGVPITEEDLRIAQEDIGSTMPRGDDAQKRKYALDYLVDLKLLAQSAEKQKLGDGPAFAKKLAYLKERALMEALMGREGATAVSDEKLKAFYDEAVKGLPQDEEVRARHILVPTENEAKDIAARLKKGEDFAKLATELSKDPGSGKQGGDLGYFGKGQMVPEFSDTAFGLKPGEVSAPVKSQFGWHIIKLEDKRTKQPPKLEEVKDELTRYMQQKAQQDMIIRLRAESKVELADEFKPKPAPAAPTPGTAAPATPAPATPAPKQ